MKLINSKKLRKNYEILNYYDIEDILSEFDTKIKLSLRNTDYQEREDLEQEIKLKIIEKLYTVQLRNPPSFWSFFTFAKNRNKEMRNSNDS